MSGFNNPVVGGQSTLIRIAIQSANYVAATSGWRIAKDGSAEFNNAIIRGELDAGGGTVRLNAGGLHIEGSGKQFDINISAGFLARLSPDDGSSLAQMYADSIGGHVLTNSAASGLGNTFTGGSMTSFHDVLGGTADRPVMQIISPAVNSKHTAQVILRGQTSTSSIDNSTVGLQANQLQINGVSVGVGWRDGNGLGSSTGAIGATETIVLDTQFIETYLAGHAYEVRVSGLCTVSAAPNRPSIRVRQSSDGVSNLGTQIFNNVPYIGVTGSQQWCGFTCKFKVGAADVSTIICVTLQGSAAFTVTGLSSPPFVMDVYDIGDAANHPNIVTIT